MNLECKTPPYLHVHMTELRRGIDGVNVSDGRHSDVLPGPHLAEIILPSIRLVGQLVKHYSHHCSFRGTNGCGEPSGDTCHFSLPLALRSTTSTTLRGWRWERGMKCLPRRKEHQINDLHHTERVEVGERDEMPSKEEGTSNTKYSWKVESL